jgi:cytochrome P450
MVMVNLADPDLYARTGGLEELRRLQREHPVYWNPLSSGGGFWALTRYADAVAVYRSPQSFTSELGIQVGQAGTASLPAAGKMMVLSDKAAHRRIKAVISRRLTPDSLARLLPRLREEAQGLARQLVGAGPFDFVTEVAGRLTLTVLGDLLGLPEEDRDRVGQWTETAFGSSRGPDPRSPAEQANPAAANAQIFVYFSGLLSRRRDTPAGDLLSALAARGPDGSRLSDEEILLNLHLLLAGGHETTRQALTGLAAVFIRYPEQWARLRACPALAPTAAQEIIRWSSPSLNVMRTATETVQIRDTVIRPGEHVTLWHPIVNRDEDQFPDAGKFDVGRDPNRHLSFGMGSHFCLGAWLAQQQLQILTHALAPHVSQFQGGGQSRRSRSTRTWGYDYLSVRLIS